tara:strand:- start:58 stop:753 length:696 start_codon:yes stop_codon:yes gene_type:complete
MQKRSIKDKYNVESIDSKETYEWLLNKHYAKRIPSISYSFGLLKKNTLIGVCTYGVPASNGLCLGLGGIKHKKKVLELNRLCVNENLNKNALSYFVSKTFKLLPKPKILVSFADTGQNHNGYIYQATNWIYTGLSDKHIFWDIVGETNNTHDRHRWDKYGGIEQAKKILGDKMIGTYRPQKHRYVYFLSNKSMKKTLKKNLKGKYKIKPYPKGENKRYDANYKPQVQARLF